MPLEVEGLCSDIVAVTAYTHVYTIDLCYFSLILMCLCVFTGGGGGGVGGGGVRPRRMYQSI